jgi:hypothetical protein
MTERNAKMDKSKNPHDSELKERLRDQAGEDHGKVKGTQVTDRNMGEKDLARGSETEARRRGNN